MTLRRLRVPAIIYLCVLGAYLGASGGRLARHSSDNHFVYLADSLLHGRLDMRVNPPHDNDWARVDELTLRDGRKVRGAFLRVGGAQDRFRTTRGQVLTLPASAIAARQHRTYVSFPPLPAVLMMPFVAIFGMAFNDVLFTILLAALAPALLFVLLRRLRESGLSARTAVDDLWLTALFGLGTVFYYCSVIGQVWYTAHVVTVLCALGYTWCALDARSPWGAGLFLGLAFLARGPTPLFMFPLFLWEAVRTSPRAVAQGDSVRAVLASVDWQQAAGKLVRFTVPVALLGAAAAAFNYARFDALTEFGHTYLNVRWTGRIQRWGLFNYHFLSRNLAAWFVLTPRILSKAPYLQVSWHGMSIFLTTPAFILLLWPKLRSRLHWPLWLTILPIFAVQALYQNDGWVQFGYRFSLDFVVFLMLLLALGGRKVGWTMRTLILIGIAVNLFGAISFGRMPHFYYDGFFPAE
ncbi:MAG TPA: hypothetical protein VGQ83_14300 [Polyangia bacterium]